jgi:hypothetical protein
VESSAVVIKKYGNRRQYDTAREHIIRLATAGGQLPVSWTCGLQVAGLEIRPSPPPVQRLSEIRVPSTLYRAASIAPRAIIRRRWHSRHPDKNSSGTQARTCCTAKLTRSNRTSVVFFIAVARIVCRKLESDPCNRIFVRCGQGCSVAGRFVTVERIAWSARGERIAFSEMKEPMQKAVAPTFLMSFPGDIIK